MRPTSVIASGIVLQLTSGTAVGQEASKEPAFRPTNQQLERRDRPVAKEDLEIPVGADEILADESMWNREDDRICADGEAAESRNLFCAFQKACVEVLGVYDHRRVALQEARFAIIDATDGRQFAHRLRDYNNLSETTFDDVKAVLLVAQERVGVRPAASENQFDADGRSWPKAGVQIGISRPPGTSGVGESWHSARSTVRFNQDSGRWAGISLSDS